MRKILLIALALVAGASSLTLEAKVKKEPLKFKKKQKKQLVVKLQNGSDSLSYAAGQMVTDGLMPYLLQQGVDTAYMADFVEGFQQVAGNNDPHVKARAAGMDIANQVMQRMVPGMQKEFTGTPDTLVISLLTRAFTDALMKDTTVMSLAQAKSLFEQKQQWNKEQKNMVNRKAGEQFLQENALKEGVMTLPSGLQYKVLVKGEGEVPQATDKVLVNYEGRLVDGTVFDASAKHGDKPASFRADQVIKGWTEALTMMPVGSKWQLYIPYNLAYGTRDMGNIKPYSCLIFDVELVGIEK